MNNPINNNAVAPAQLPDGSPHHYSNYGTAYYVTGYTPATPITPPQLSEQQQVVADLARYYDAFDTAAGRGRQDGVISDRDLQAVLDNPGQFGNLDSEQVRSMVAAAEYLLETEPDFLRELAGGDTKMDRREFATHLSSADFPEGALTTTQQAAVDRAHLLGLAEQAHLGEVDYAAVEELAGQILERSQEDSAYAVELFANDLGAEGVYTVLQGLGQIVSENIPWLNPEGISGAQLQRDIFTPLTESLAIAMSEPGGAELADGLLAVDSPAAQWHLALMLASDNGSLSSNFVALAADALLVQDSYHTPNSFYGGELNHISGGNNYGADSIALDALRSNPEAAYQYVTSLEAGESGVNAEGFSSTRMERLDGLMRWPAAGPFSDEINAELAGQVLEHALIDYPDSPGAPANAQQRADAALWRMMDEAGEGDVPDAMKLQLAGIAALRIEHIGDMVSASQAEQIDVFYMNGLPENGLVPDFAQSFQEFAQEIGYDNDAALLLTAAGVEYMTIQGEHVSTELSDISEISAPEIELAFQHEFGKAAELFSLMGAGFDDAGFDQQQRHDALFSSLSAVSNGGVGIGLAVSPLTGGTSAAAGIGLRHVTGEGLDWLKSATAPDSVDLGEFLDSATGPMSSVVATAIYNNPDARQAMLDSRTSTQGMESITYEEFLELPQVRDLLTAVVSPTENNIMTGVLFNDFLR